MKKILFLLFLIPILAWSQTASQNYVRTYIYKEPSTTTDASKANAAVTYYDGLGRPMQQIQGKMSATGKDIVTHIEYDPSGRKSKDYLPYAAATADLSYVGSANTDVVNFYNQPAFENTSNPYSEKFFELSPLNRVLKVGAPGTLWKGNTGDDNDHTVKFAYLPNTGQEVRKFIAIASSGSSEISLTDGGFYTAGNLSKTITQNENKTASIVTSPTTQISNKLNTTEEFRDKQGRLILNRTFNMAPGATSSTPEYQQIDTYYVYDQYGNLTYVIPPLSNGSLATLDLLCYQYKYDERNRLVEKKLPGKDWEYIVYDKMDRRVASGPVYSPYGSTGNGAKGWLITKYDDFGRVACTGWYATATAFSSASRKNMQANTFSTVVKSATAVSIDNIQLNYTNVGFPTSDMKLLTVNYYDNYAFTGAAAIPADVEGQTLAANVKGLPTGTWNRILTDPTQSYAEITTTFYDFKGRAIRIKASNTLYGGYTQTDTKLDFDGTPLYNVTRHKRTSSSTETELKIQNDFTYTSQDRLLSETHTIGSGTAQLMSYNTYNAIGQLTAKNVGRTQASPLQKVDFTYNIRGWLTGINNISSLSPLGQDIQDLFAFKINYNQVQGLANIVPLYNGNIAETTWRTASDNIMRRYSYKYDELNRLRDAYYQIPNATESPLRQSYDEHLKYDVTGNITSLTRNGGVDAPSPVVEIDNLKYYYNGNQLMRVEDTSNSPQGYRDLTTGTANDFAYDTFGNLVSDYNKGFDLIIYNHLNLPLKIQINDGGNNIGLITYLYTASGTKLRKTITDFQFDNNNKTTDYINGFQYTNGVLDFFPTSEGYVKNTVVNGANNYSYVYQYKDHLGNVRVSYTLDRGVVKIMDENHYYPFGMEHEGYQPTQTILGLEPGNTVRLVPVINPGNVTYKYKYNGKELQDELGLDMYGMDWRQYDPAIARWTAIDPIVHHTTSPYSAFENNPVYWADPSGMAVVDESDRITFTGADAGNFFTSYVKYLNSGSGSDFYYNSSGDSYSYAFGFDDGGDGYGNARGYSNYSPSSPGPGLFRKLWTWLFGTRSQKQEEIQVGPLEPTKGQLWYEEQFGAYLSDSFRKSFTFSDAIWHYRLGNGMQVNVNANSLDFSNVKVSDFDNPEFIHEGAPGIWVRFDNKNNYVNPSQALIYGTVDVVYIGNNSIMILPNKYDFDMKFEKGTFKRDFATMLGSMYNGYGTPYWINFIGTTKISD